MWDLIICVVILIINLIITVILLQGKGLFLIAGFNMLPNEQKKKLDIVNLCRFMGKVSLALSFCLMLLITSLLTKNEFNNQLALIILAITIIIGLYWSSYKYRKPLRK